MDVALLWFCFFLTEGKYYVNKSRSSGYTDFLWHSQAGQALTYDELQGLTYLQVKGSGIANTCPVLESGSSNIKDLKAGTYRIEKLCLEPTSFTVKEESEFKGKEAGFQKTRLMTRLTYTLDEV